MLEKRKKIVFYLLILCGGFTGLVFFRWVTYPFFKLIRITGSNVWLGASVTTLIGILLFVLCARISVYRYRSAFANKGIDIASIIIFFTCGLIAMDGGILFLGGLLSLVIQVLGVFLPVKVL
jgi:hypothetical protein